MSTMDFSLTSSLNGAKSFLSHPHSKKGQQQHPHSMLVVSCRGTKFATENETPNFYKVLSLTPSNASVDEIKRAYRTMSLRYHPDVCHPSMKEESTRIFVQLHVAYKTLSDPVQREEYDCRLGLRNLGQAFKTDIKQGTKNRWQDQILELKKRSTYRMARDKSSWGSRIRAQNI